MFYSICTRTLLPPPIDVSLGYNNNKCFSFQIDHINDTIYLPEGREFKNIKVEIRNKIYSLSTRML